jgi:N-acetylmuramoyl-L-alanine amidase
MMAAILKSPKHLDLPEMNGLARFAAIGSNWFPGLLAILLTACAPLPSVTGIPMQWQPSPNFDERRPNFVIIHATSNDTADQALRTLTDPQRQVSAHYLIGRDGRTYQLVDERARAWHAGESKWGADSDLNSVSLGIELDNNGDEPFPDIQISALLTLLDGIRERYRIPAANYLGHADIAPRRKVDPSRYFPWETLARHGYGLWCNPPFPEPPAAMDATLALRAVGYDVSALEPAIRAFKRHFVQDDTTPELTDRDRSVLYCLLSKGTD